jgi:hypothetical protein
LFYRQVLVVSVITHRSLGKSIPFSPLFSYHWRLIFFPAISFFPSSHWQHHPNPYPLPLSPLLHSVRRRQAGGPWAAAAGAPGRAQRRGPSGWRRRATGASGERRARTRGPSARGGGSADGLQQAARAQAASGSGSSRRQASTGRMEVERRRLKHVDAQGHRRALVWAWR